jgi:ectoine hydroxylase
VAVRMDGALAQGDIDAGLGADGYLVLGQLPPPLLEELLEAADSFGDAYFRQAGVPELHMLSCLHRHPDFLDIIDWPPLLAAIIGLLSPNIYVHHSHLDIHPPHDKTPGRRWHRDGGVQGRDMRLWPIDQPRLSVKAGIFLTEVAGPDDGALEVIPGSHRDTASRPPDIIPEDSVSVTVPAGTVLLFDARVWHRRRDNLGTVTRKAIFLAYTYRWIATRDDLFESQPSWPQLPPVRRQLLGDRTWEAFYPRPGELPVEEWLAASKAGS